MAVEIERKFLVDLERCPLPANGRLIRQGYIQTTTNTAVRVRIRGDSAFLTLKGENRGAARSEFEYSIPVEDALQIVAEMCEGRVVEKTRYEIPFANHLWEVDIFSGKNQGLCIAEVELASEDEPVDLPPWVTEEVTGDPRYYNANLLGHPYQDW